MRRVYGGDAPKVECIDKQTKTCVRWDYRGEGEEHSFMEECYPVKPTLSQFKETVYSWVNQKAVEAINSGFKYDGVQVWLSNENQANYERTYTRLLQGSVALPVKVRGGSNELPQYLVFETAVEFATFWDACSNYIDETQHAAWKEKDEYDFSEYEQLLEA